MLIRLHGWRQEAGHDKSIRPRGGHDHARAEPRLAQLALSALGRRLVRERPHHDTALDAGFVAGCERALIDAPTIHDFGGFPQALYQLQYPAAGAPEVAQRAIELLAGAGIEAQGDERRPLDHGAWVPLMHLLPQADVPVFQVSLPARLDGAGAYAYGQALAPLADEGVLIVGSGSLTHNLYEVRFDAPDATAESYAVGFADWIADTLRAHDHERLQQTMHLAPHAQRAHPTTEHLWPLLVAAGAAGAGQPVTRIDGGMTHGVLSMDAFVFGDAVAHA